MPQEFHTAATPDDFIDLSWLIGRTTTNIAFREPAFWVFEFKPGGLISVECLWRIIQLGRVALTSEDHGHLFGRPAGIDAAAASTELLLGQPVSAVTLSKDTADLVISFGGDLRLEIVPTSSGYEGWQLREPSGTSYVAQGGGQISKWKS